MPSRALGIALALLVVLSGCSMVPGGGGDASTATPTRTPPDHHELVLAASVAPYDATITVTRDGETVYEGTVSDDAGHYRNLTALADGGPYTVTVNATLGPHGSNRSTRTTIDGDVGNATVIRAGYRGISTETFALPRRPMQYELGAYSQYMNPGGSARVDLEVWVRYRGEPIGNASVELERDVLTRVLDLERTGVYHVSARTEEGWTNRTVLVASTDRFIEVSIGPQGDVKRIRPKVARRWAGEGDS